MSDNIYSLVVARMSDEDLIDALNAREKYVDEMLLEMLEACTARNIIFPDAEALKQEIMSRQEPEVVPEPEKPPVVLPVFFSQTAILAFTIFFSPLFGGILLAMNVNRVNKKAVWQIVAFTIIFTLFSGYVSYFLAPGSVFAILIPIAGALIFSELLWNTYIGRQIAYTRRSVTAPLLIALAIAIPLAFYLYKHQELLQIPAK